MSVSQRWSVADPVANRVALWGLCALAATLPRTERERLEQRYSLDSGPWSLGLGIVQIAVGLSAYAILGFAFARGQWQFSSWELVKTGDPSLATTHVMMTGFYGWFAWLIFPGSWPLLGVAVVGALRTFQYVADGRAMAEPVVWLVFELRRRLSRRRTRLRRRRELGPPRPDRWIPRSDGIVEVVSCREKPDWIEAVGIEVDGRLFRLVSFRERTDRTWVGLAFELKEFEPGRLVRRRVSYEPRSTPPADAPLWVPHRFP